VPAGDAAAAESPEESFTRPPPYAGRHARAATITRKRARVTRCCQVQEDSKRLSFIPPHPPWKKIASLHSTAFPWPFPSLGLSLFPSL